MKTKIQLMFRTSLSMYIQKKCNGVTPLFLAIENIFVYSGIFILSYLYQVCMEVSLKEVVWIVYQLIPICRLQAHQPLLTLITLNVPGTVCRQLYALFINYLTKPTPIAKVIYHYLIRWKKGLKLVKWHITGD